MDKEPLVFKEDGNATGSGADGKGGASTPGGGGGKGAKNKRPETAMKRVYKQLKRFTLAFAALALAIFVYMCVGVWAGLGLG